MNLNKKIAMVTGGSRGIGKAIALSLAKAGARVALTYLQQEGMARDVVAALKNSGGEAIALQMEVSSRDSVRAALQKINKDWGAVEILVNNAAIAQEKPFETITDENWGRMLAINLSGPFICTQEVIPVMVKQGWGRIINIASIGGQWGGFNQVHYAAAKAGLISLTRSMAKIYSKYGITTNAVSPGLVGTDMVQRELNTEAGQEKVRNIPVRRIATPEEVTNVVVFLASEGASYITGQTINVNGGMYFG